MKLNMDNLIANWKTTTAGVGILVTSVFGIVHNWKTLDANGWSAAVTGLLTGLGLLYASDSNVKPPTN